MFIFLRKISLILMALYLTSAGKVIQGLVIFLAIILFLFISIRSKPFVYPELNNMENLSLLICAVTVYCGLFFTSKDNPEGSNFCSPYLLYVYSERTNYCTLDFLCTNSNNEPNVYILLAVQDLTGDSIVLC